MLEEKPKKQSPSVCLKYCLKKLTNEVSALTRKNFLIFSRNKYITFLLLICPFFICVYLNQIQIIVDQYTESLANPHPREISISQIPKCFGNNCITLGIGLTGGPTEWTDYVIDHIAKSSGLKKNKDIRVLTSQNPQNFTKYIRKNMNTTGTGLILCSNYMDIPENKYLERIHCDDTKGQVYLIVYNFTEVPKDLFDPNLPNPLEINALSVKLAIDSAIVSYQARKKGLKDIFFEAVIQSYPLPENRFLKGYDAVSMTGPLYFFIPPMFVFGLLISEIVKEKEEKLRNGLSVIGVSATAFWFSWFLVALFFSFMTTNSLILSGYLFQFDLFLKTSYLILLALFLAYSLTMMVLGFMISTLISSVKLSYTVSYTFLLGGLVLQNFFTSPTLMKLFHIEGLPNWVYWVRVVFSYYPPFNFSKIFSDIAAKAGSTPNYHERKWQTGPGYYWDDFFMERSGWMFGGKYVVPSSFDTLLDLLWNCFILMVFTWYFDHIIEGNRGRASPPWFMFTCEYWGIKRKSSLTEEIEMRNVTASNLVKSDNTEIVEGIKLDKIWKKYPHAKTCAVKPLSLIIEKEECVSIIGHNGAGKTTLLSMLTGLLSPSGGTAYVSGYDINYELEKVHQTIGYCPQFNILWNEMTGTEHLWLFAKLRNIPLETRQQLVDQKLQEVNLGKAGDKTVGTYSGGMKRRLSVAISSIGNPSVIFMDEPTTGMDPITRRQVWRLIQNMKKDRVIILTTHSMEEAEILSDRIVVMVDGEIKCSGPSLYLKNHYGEGYKVELIDGNPKALWDHLSMIIPSLKLVDISGNSLFISIPRTEPKLAQMFFETVEQLKIQDWGLKNSSLEEVFMKVTGSLKDL